MTSSSSHDRDIRAAALDASDPLGHFRGEFLAPVGTTYLVGHSLGLLSRRARVFTEEALTQWETRGVEAWFDPQPDSIIGPWLEIEARISAACAPLLGSRPEDVTVMGGLGTNLGLVLQSLYRPFGERRRIGVSRAAFPQDRWLVENFLKLPHHHPSDITWLEGAGLERGLTTADVVAALEADGARMAILLVEAVGYCTGELLDLGVIGEVARRQGVIVVADIAHAFGAVPCELNRWGIDAAIGCSYKFGCSGPGGVGLLYMNERHWSDPATWRPGGWWGNESASRFLMGGTFVPGRGAAGWRVSTVPVLAAVPFLGALELFGAAGSGAIRSKGLRLTDFLWTELEPLAVTGGFRIVTPRVPERRGSEIVLEFADRARALRINESLRKRGILVDYRESPFPGGADNQAGGLIRIGVHPLFNSYGDVCRCVDALAGLVTLSEGDKPL
jgi:kynureninase